MFGQPVWAQDDTSDGREPADGRLVIDILAPSSEQERDPVSVQQCRDEADAARIAGEIVVCRSLGESSDGAWNQQDFERGYAARTQGIKTPNVDGSGLQLPTEGSVITVTVTVKPRAAPPPPLMIDIEALPEAPPGSDADRAARGLDPVVVE